jgi:hypothetical protein
MGRERPHSDLIERGWHFIADEIRALPDPRIAYHSRTVRRSPLNSMSETKCRGCVRILSFLPQRISVLACEASEKGRFKP